MIILISHRGNFDGPNPAKENHPDYVDDAICRGFDAEVDLWAMDYKLYLGHSEPKYLIDFEWLEDHHQRLWIHCQNIGALQYMTTKRTKYWYFDEGWDMVTGELNFFWHQTDDYALTNCNYVWTFPGKELPIRGTGIAVMPEKAPGWDIRHAVGICSDFLLDKID